MFKMVMMIIVIVFCRMMMINIMRTSNRKAKNLFKQFLKNLFKLSRKAISSKCMKRGHVTKKHLCSEMIRIVEIIRMIRIFFLSKAKNKTKTKTKTRTK